jgi:hypothetical protein
MTRHPGARFAAQACGQGGRRTPTADFFWISFDRGREAAKGTCTTFTRFAGAGGTAATLAATRPKPRERPIGRTVHGVRVVPALSAR